MTSVSPNIVSSKTHFTKAKHEFLTRLSRDLQKLGIPVSVKYKKLTLSFSANLTGYRDDMVVEFMRREQVRRVKAARSFVLRMTAHGVATRLADGGIIDPFAI